ncbi:MAG TPA: phage baseplate assembly protein V [Usitatibacter sp.]|nr:phage baseplate assembly protein V [Usitatibacter sp.]
MKEIKGIVTGTVKEIDPAAARVRLDFNWMQPPQRSHWAPIAALMSGKGRGTYYMPEIDDEALVAFEQGDFDHPYVIGFLWNGVDTPPSSEPRLRLIHSVNGHEIGIYDPPASAGDKGFIRIADAHGNVIELGNRHITIIGTGNVQINAPNVTINGRLVAPVGPPI